jgi:protein-tyrosine phosphatase
MRHDRPVGREEIMIEQLARLFNFRDLGGVRSGDGREVRRGTLYRSASLSELAREHIAAVRTLNIRSVIDLRYNSEREIHPTPWQELGCSAYWCRDYEPAGGRGGLNDLLESESLTTAAARDLMLRVYPELTYSNVDSLKRLFRTILTDEGPFLVHCTSGKDRTGIAAALVLSALDVSRDAILADYLATNRFDILASPAFRRDEPFAAERIEIIRPIFSVDSEYLDCMFDGIVARDGSLGGFFRKTLDLSASDLDVCRERLLADGPT